jgi:hypothetical protein
MTDRFRFLVGQVLVAVGAAAFAIAFRSSLAWLYRALFAADDVVDAVRGLPPWMRFALPVCGATCAGVIALVRFVAACGGRRRSLFQGASVAIRTGSPPSSAAAAAASSAGRRARRRDRDLDPLSGGKWIRAIECVAQPTTGGGGADRPDHRKSHRHECVGGVRRSWRDLRRAASRRCTWHHLGACSRVVRPFHCGRYRQLRPCRNGGDNSGEHPRAVTAAVLVFELSGDYPIAHHCSSRQWFQQRSPGPLAPSRCMRPSCDGRGSAGSSHSKDGSFRNEQRFVHWCLPIVALADQTMKLTGA